MKNKIEEKSISTNQKELSGKVQGAIRLFAAGVAIFHIWANTIGNISDLWRNSLHFALLGCLGFIIYPAVKKTSSDSKKTKFDFILSLLVLSTSIYLILFENALHVRNEVPVFFDLLFAGISIILALELTRRTTGLIIPILALFFLTYVIWWGQYVVGIFNFRGMNISRSFIECILPMRGCLE
jgi:TRAP-type uncharacterized transport system fused permease subunit